MRIRKGWLIKLIGLLGHFLIRLWIGTLRHRMRSHAPSYDPHRRRNRHKFIITFWHENLLLPAYYMGPDYQVLISQHGDGQMIAEVCRMARARTIRGSTTRGGVEATRHLLRAAGKQHLVVVPDGPRGPRRRLKPGIIHLAARTGLPILAIGVAFQSPWRLPTWDRFALPRPFSDVGIIIAEPIAIPADIPMHQVEHYRDLVEQRLRVASTIAEKWAATGECAGSVEGLITTTEAPSYTHRLAG